MGRTLEKIGSIDMLKTISAESVSPDRILRRSGNHQKGGSIYGNDG
jgi:hypothetical protein